MPLQESMDLTEKQKEDLVIEILREPMLTGILDDINNKSEWWIRITEDNPPVHEIIRRYAIACLY